MIIPQFHAQIAAVKKKFYFWWPPRMMKRAAEIIKLKWCCPWCFSFFLHIHIGAPQLQKLQLFSLWVLQFTVATNKRLNGSKLPFCKRKEKGKSKPAGYSMGKHTASSCCPPQQPVVRRWNSPARTYLLQHRSPWRLQDTEKHPVKHVHGSYFWTPAAATANVSLFPGFI